MREDENQVTRGSYQERGRTGYQQPAIGTPNNAHASR